MAMTSSPATLALLVVVTCAVPGHAQRLYWAAEGLGTIESAMLDGSDRRIELTGIGAPTDLAVDGSTGRIYWTDQFAGEIWSACPRGGQPRLIVPGLARPWGLAIDAALGKLVWSDYALGSVSRADLDGSALELLHTGLNSPWGLDLDSTTREVRVGNAGAGDIVHITDGGSGTLTTISVPGGTGPTCVGVDLMIGRMFWTDSGIDLIYAADLDGQNAQVLFASSNPTGLCVDPIGQRIYWSDTLSGLIERGDYAGGSREVIVAATAGNLEIVRAPLPNCCATCGDCDLNGSSPDILDALVAAQLDVGLLAPSPEQELCCDVDTSGAVRVLDSLRIAQFAAGLGVTLACP